MPSVSMRVESSRPVAGHLTIKEVMRGFPFRVTPPSHSRSERSAQSVVKRNRLGSMIPLLLNESVRVPRPEPVLIRGRITDYPFTLLLQRQGVTRYSFFGNVPFKCKKCGGTKPQIGVTKSAPSA